eukprot:TRINITY_DN12540_c0_g5_i1.p1 TRINITY_DN12540_c0_g5~~TRINITY_DN12540_c0_g5_i1.p1  ORF type:complete len:712 (+),score=112.95 TRINITY_DN12540_c0_g5_i1:100-2235(+)
MEGAAAAATVFSSAASPAAVEGASVVASAGLLGGISRAVLAKVGGSGVIAAAGGAEFEFVTGAASAAAGALAVKVWCDQEQKAIAERLADVQSFALASTYSLGVVPQEAAKQLLEVVDWYLAAEEAQLKHGGPGDFVYDLLATPAARAFGIRGVSEAGTSGIPDGDFRRNIIRVRKICSGSALQSARRTKRQARGESSTSRRRSTCSLTNEEYSKLFNPRWANTCGKHGLCPALGYIVRSFLELRRHPQGNLGDGQRVALRFAVSALARHPVFDELEHQEAAAEQSEVNEEHLFRLTALAILCIIDGALSWRPSDPLGWSGKCEDAEGMVLAREKGYCTFQHWASKLRDCLKKVCSGRQAAKRCLEVHLDIIRSRQLPNPWPYVWYQNQEASMLVRNKTKVPLRVELYRPKALIPSPWTDWSLLRNFYADTQVVLVADVEPGIEWAFRPKAVEGSNFKVRLVTASGVVVCSRRLNRGQTFDFEVPVPPRPKTLIGLTTEVGSRVVSEDSVRETGSKGRSITAPSEVPSTSASTNSGSDRSSPFVGMHSSSSQSSRVEGLTFRRLLSQTNPIPEEPNDELQSHPHGSEEEYADSREDGEAQGREVFLAPKGFRASMCPRCLHSMPLRRHRPGGSIYSAGVRCDKCSVELMVPRGEDEDTQARCKAEEAFCHCSRCWYDLCQYCAYNEMEEVWWEKRQDPSQENVDDQGHSSC